MNTTTHIIPLLMSTLLLMTACADPATITPTTHLPQGADYTPEATFSPGTVDTKGFSSVEELRSFLEQAQGSSSYGGMQFRGGGIAMDMAVAQESDSSNKLSAPTIGYAGSDDYSQTNNQVAGVDEGDIIKTDGEYIYTISGQTLYIVKAGEDAELIFSLTYEDRTPQGLFVDGSTLVIFGDQNQYDYDYIPQSGLTYVEIIDITERNKPTTLKEYAFEGSYFNSRMIGENAYIITRSTPNPWYGPIVPIYYEDGIMREQGLASIKRFSTPYESAEFITIHALDLSKKNTDSLTLAVEYAQQLYMSEENMYVSFTKWINEWETEQDVTIETVIPLLNEADAELINRIQTTDNDILSTWEKKGKISQLVYRYISMQSDSQQQELHDEIEQKVTDILDQYDYREYTIINKVTVDGQDMELTATTTVPGSLNNQFSMDEFEGNLRVATTTSMVWSSYKNTQTDSENHIFTLDKNLNELDHKDGIAPGESIYSTRFMGERLYMVTFRQVDPFFVFDLSDARNIKEMGSLKIPGFSRYLHPYDENTIIGIGQDASTMGRTQGLKISLFDVSDVEHPDEIAKYVAQGRYSSSVAEYEHKAFLFSKEKNLLVIPMYSYSDGEDFNGALVFDIAKDHIEARALIDHAGSVEYRWSAGVERSLYIGDLLYTKSHGLLRVNTLGDLSSVASITLEPDVFGDLPIV